MCANKLNTLLPFWTECIVNTIINEILNIYLCFHLWAVDWRIVELESCYYLALLLRLLATGEKVAGSWWSSSLSRPPLQACSYTHEQIVEMMEFLIEYGPAQLYWEPAEVFLKLSCVQLLLQLISIACNWKTYYARWDQREVSNEIRFCFLLNLILICT